MNRKAGAQDESGDDDNGDRRAVGVGRRFRRCRRRGPCRRPASQSSASSVGPAAGVETTLPAAASVET